MKRKFYLLLFMCFCASMAWGQTRKVSGRVISDSTKQPLNGVNISVKGGTAITTTDNQGQFSITVPDKGNPVLVFSSVGYNAQEVSVGQKNSINLTLTTASNAMNEVVVIGYQTVRRRDLTSAVSSVTAKDLRDNPTVSAAEAIQGKLAGVQVTVSEGEPGAPVDINIRGRSSITQSGAPLYVVDGVQLDNALNVLSPQDIESIDVLKDAASTAIYGARGANGVVIITTKGGKNTNGRTSVNYNNSIGIQELPKELSVMNPLDFVKFQYERAKYTNDTSVISRYWRSTDPYSRVLDYANVEGIDWQKEMFGRKALLMTHNFGVSGGNAQTQYNLSATFNKQQGILKTTDYNRQLLNFRFDHQANSKLKVGFNVRFNNNVLWGEGVSDAGGAGSNNLRQVVRYQPLLLPNQAIDEYDVNQANSTNGNGLALINPLRLLEAQYRRKTNRVLNLNANITYQPFKNLTIRSIAAIDYNSTEARAFDDTITNNSRTNNKQPLITLNNASTRTINNSNTISYDMRNMLGSKHNLNVLVGQETYQTYAITSFTDLRNFPIGTSPDQAFGNYALAQTTIQPTSSEVPIQNFSFFSRLSYNLKQRYYLTFNLRADASSIFGEKHKWGYFPSGSFAWRVSDEAFMAKQNVVSDLKLRLSYGAVGNNRISPFQYTSLYTAGRPYFLNDAFVFGLGPSNLGNPDLRWESQQSKNIGLDAAFFKGRVQLTVDAYRNNSKNLLLNNAIPYNSGYTTQFQNVGATQNTGLEIQLNGTILKKKDLTWNGNFNISFNKNIIKSLGDQSQFVFNSGYFNSNSQPADFLVKVGGEVGTMYGLISDGYYQLSDFNTTPFSNALYPWATTKYTLNAKAPVSRISSTPIMPGTQKFKDINNDGFIDANDYTVIGHALPKFSGGFGQQLTYKGFDLNVFLNFVYGNSIANYNKLEFSSTYTNGGNLLSEFTDRWHIADPTTGVQLQGQPNTTIGVVGASPDVIANVNSGTKFWIPVTGVEWQNAQSYAVEDGSYLRINNITLGYTLPKSVLSKVKLSNARIFVTGSNLGTLTGYSGYDPDVSTRRSTPVTAGVDYSAYPKSRTFVGGINITF